MCVGIFAGYTVFKHSALLEQSRLCFFFFLIFMIMSDGCVKVGKQKGQMSCSGWRLF